MTRNTVALYDMVVSVSPTSAAWLLLVAGQSWPMTADSAFGLGALPNRAMQVMPPRCLHPGAPPSGRATRPHAPGCCSGSGAQTDGWDCRDPQCRMRVTVVSRADYCAGPYRYGCSAPRARPSRRHCHRQNRPRRMRHDRTFGACTRKRRVLRSFILPKRPFWHDRAMTDDRVPGNSPMRTRTVQCRHCRRPMQSSEERPRCKKHPSVVMDEA